MSTNRRTPLYASSMRRFMPAAKKDRENEVEYQRTLDQGYALDNRRDRVTNDDIEVAGQGPTGTTFRKQPYPSDWKRPEIAAEALYGVSARPIKPVARSTDNYEALAYKNQLQRRLHGLPYQGEPIGPELIERELRGRTVLEKKYGPLGSELVEQEKLKQMAIDAKKRDDDMVRKKYNGIPLPTQRFNFAYARYEDGTPKSGQIVEQQQSANRNLEAYEMAHQNSNQLRLEAKRVYASGNIAAGRELARRAEYVLSNAERDLLAADPSLALYMQRKREQDQSQFSDIATPMRSRIGSMSTDSNDSFFNKTRQEREDERKKIVSMMSGRVSELKEVWAEGNMTPKSIENKLKRVTKLSGKTLDEFGKKMHYLTPTSLQESENAFSEMDLTWRNIADSIDDEKKVALGAKTKREYVDLAMKADVIREKLRLAKDALQLEARSRASSEEGPTIEVSSSRESSVPHSLPLEEEALPPASKSPTGSVPGTPTAEEEESAGAATPSAAESDPVPDKSPEEIIKDIQGAEYEVTSDKQFIRDYNVIESKEFKDLSEDAQSEITKKLFKTLTHINISARAFKGIDVSKKWEYLIALAYKIYKPNGDPVLMSEEFLNFGKKDRKRFITMLNRYKFTGDELAYLQNQFPSGPK